MSSISPVAGVLPQQPASTTANCALAPAPLASSAAAATAPGLAPSAAAGVAPAAAAGGGLVQAAQGVQAAVPPELVPVLQQLVDVLAQLVVALQQQQQGGGVAGGGAGGAVGQCGMSGCTMDHSAQPTTGGASGAPTAAGASAGPGHDPGQFAAAPIGSTSRVDPGTVKDKASTAGLTPASLAGLEVAHSFGLPLVSGKRDGDPSKSEHPSGRAIDVGTLPIGDPASTENTPQMQAYAEHMRQEAMSGRLDVKYIIRDGQISSPTDNWAWRAYTYPGESTSSLEAMKRDDRGSYNRLQHHDHVHVSFN